MNDLQVECYDAKEVAAKKQSIKKSLAIAGGVLVISAGLSFFACGGNGAWYNCTTEPWCECDPCECIGRECIQDETEPSDDLDP